MLVADIFKNGEFMPSLSGHGQIITKWWLQVTEIFILS
jgi:hypothetical protein